MEQEAAEHGLLTRIDDQIGEALKETEDIFLRELECLQPCVSDILTHVTRFRGKRLRPILLLLSAEATGGIRDDHKVLAAVVEMIHAATLVHDDVLDEAETRRHVATVNARWNNETSVLFGDYLFTHAFHLASSLESTLACRLIGRATNIVCTGELSQIHERGNFELSEERYLEIVEGKTAELCALCCFLGAHFAHAEEAVAHSLEDYGRFLGIAFQIRDDLLDILGNEDKTGKSLGSDFAKQKLTLPLIRLLDQSSEADVLRIRELLMHPSQQSRVEIEQLLAQSDAIEYSRSQTDRYVSSARQSLACLPASSAKQILEDVTEFAAHRSY